MRASATLTLLFFLSGTARAQLACGNVTPEQPIQIMMSNGARILGEHGERGTVAPGKAADLVVIRGNPVATPSDIYEVVTVFKDGIGSDSMKLREGAKGKVGAS